MPSRAANHETSRWRSYGPIFQPLRLRFCDSNHASSCFPRALLVGQGVTDRALAKSGMESDRGGCFLKGSLTPGKNADPHCPVIKQAKAEHAKLR